MPPSQGILKPILEAVLKVCFVQTCNRAFTDTQMFGIYFMPVWAYTLAAFVENIPGVDILFFDERVTDRSTIPSADLYLFTGINQDADAIFELRDFVRKTQINAKLVLGGPITWSYHTAGKLEAITGFDHIFIGDGEKLLPEFLENILKGKKNDFLLQADKRFDLTHSIPTSKSLIQKTYSNYYGGVIEVSRGCPFLCEFCDIRILPDNNRSHVKNPDLIVEELDFMARLGVGQVLFACDNFIGNLAWAEEVCDKIIAWSEKSGLRVSLYTWLTINLSKNPRLLRKLRLAGFDMFFIGVESFYNSSLLETAKIQNTGNQLKNSIREIQSYGFIVVAGLIFGFDSDPNDIAKITLNGIVESGLISGDPSLLMALPGTPLYKRMKSSGRLREMKFNLGGFKYQTNIKYLRPSDQIQGDFLNFVSTFTSGPYQLERLKAFYACLESSNYLAPKTAGYADMKRLFQMTFRGIRHVNALISRFSKLFLSVERIQVIAKAFWFTFRNHSKQKPLWFYFKFWLFNWSNALVKYSTLSAEDFNIDWVGADYDIRRLLPENYFEGGEQIPIGKINNQRQYTSQALKDLIAMKIQEEA